MTSPSSFHLEVAHAKLTVSLRVVGVRPDGYHLIDAEMVSVDLVDHLAFHDADASSIGMELKGPATSGLPIDTGGDNLVIRALDAVGRKAHVEIVKHIPAGAGLGGGSSDAAAVYRWAERTSGDDLVASAALGADVPFCVRGGRARVTGIGEVIEPLEFEPRTFTLMIPPFGVPTPAVYKAWDDLGGPAGEHGNDLEAAALAVEPRLAEYRDRLQTHSARRPTLAGSGGTWFVAGAFPGPDVVVVHAVHRHDRI